MVLLVVDNFQKLYVHLEANINNFSLMRDQIKLLLRIFLKQYLVQILM